VKGFWTTLGVFIAILVGFTGLVAFIAWGMMTKLGNYVVGAAFILRLGALFWQLAKSISEDLRL